MRDLQILYLFVKQITVTKNNRTFSFLYIVFYWKNNLKLCVYSLVDTGVKSLLKVLNQHKRATPVFIQRFINFTPVSAEVTISFVKLTSHPSESIAHSSLRNNKLLLNIYQ